jgi:hypothetical protein
MADTYDVTDHAFIISARWCWRSTEDAPIPQQTPFSIRDLPFFRVNIGWLAAFLTMQTTAIPLSELVPELFKIHNMRLKLERLSDG